MGNLFAQYYNYSADYDTTNIDPSSGAYGLAVLILLVIGLISYAIVAYFMGRIFQKAGVEAWKAWVPVYNNWTMLQLGGQQGFWAILMLIPIVNIVAMIMLYIAMYHVGLKLGKPGAFVVLAIFIPLVWLGWLAFDTSKWHGKKTTAPTADTTD